MTTPHLWAQAMLEHISLDAIGVRLQQVGYQFVGSLQSGGAAWLLLALVLGLLLFRGAKR